MAEPVTLAEIKAACDILRTDQDATITDLGVSGRRWVEGYTGLMLVPTDVVVISNEFEPEIWLRGWPIASDAEITIDYVGTDGTDVTLADYRLRAATRPAFLLPAFGASWPSVDCGTGAVTVSYTAGYADPADVPLDLKRAIFVYVRQHIDNGMLTRDGERAMESLCRFYVLDFIG